MLLENDLKDIKFKSINKALSKQVVLKSFMLIIVASSIAKLNIAKTFY